MFFVMLAVILELAALGIIWNNFLKSILQTLNEQLKNLLSYFMSGRMSVWLKVEKKIIQ